MRNAALVARRHELRERLVPQWVRQAARAGRFPIPDPATVAALTAAEGENRHLKELLGEKDLEIAILKESPNVSRRWGMSGCSRCCCSACGRAAGAGPSRAAPHVPAGEPDPPHRVRDPQARSGDPGVRARP